MLGEFYCNAVSSRVEALGMTTALLCPPQLRDGTRLWALRTSGAQKPKQLSPPFLFLTLPPPPPSFFLHYPPLEKKSAISKLHNIISCVSQAPVNHWLISYALNKGNPVQRWNLSSQACVYTTGPLEMHEHSCGQKLAESCSLLTASLCQPTVKR